jgi:hypothetical protein
MTATPQEAIAAICDTHFPRSHPYKGDNHVGQMTRSVGTFVPQKADWRTVEKIRAALSEFNTEKSPGPDELGPSVLQHLPSSALDAIQYLYDATITSGYTPNIWRQSKVIFIPKSGKTDYSQAKSFRPISLTPYLFKCLEKLCKWRIT